MKSAQRQSSGQTALLFQTVGGSGGYSTLPKNQDLGIVKALAKAKVRQGLDLSPFPDLTFAPSSCHQWVIGGNESKLIIQKP